MSTLTAENIDELLPQTQCGLCGYGGCRPYAEAIARQQAPINLCPPGGIKTLVALAQLTQQDAKPYLADMQQKALPSQLAHIREDLCIGCTKCLAVCPTDAIIGARKQMHSIITDACTGCGLCLPPCPMDCIDLHTIATLSASKQYQQAQQSRQRYAAHNQRLQQQQAPISKQAEETITYLNVQQAIARALEKKNPTSG